MDESNFKDIIKQAQQVLYCPTCGRTYQLEEIRLRGFFDDTLILQTICSNHHAPALTLFLTNIVHSDKGRKLEIRPAGRSPRSAAKRVTKDDVLDLHESLRHFNGDFRKLWNIS